MGEINVNFVVLPVNDRNYYILVFYDKPQKGINAYLSIFSSASVILLTNFFYLNWVSSLICLFTVLMYIYSLIVQLDLSIIQY